ncbi:hypothetical protein NFO65_22365 [Neorhizobium galegae]|uniref:hypothetical protein n=1 Tax=Neorhizobium galegae TaxID=399 RepID=UPI0021019294|nr:hypothetical protein [Neorhizobium galegae]MCQ1573474.1 hypothetical protein [Neorhizobium galegae]
MTGQSSNGQPATSSILLKTFVTMTYLATFGAVGIGGAAFATDQLTWQFSAGSRGSAKACTIITGLGKIIVGFTAEQGQGYKGFAVNLIKGETRATWRVDDGSPVVSDGQLVNNDASWLTAEDLPPRLLADVARGSELAITSANGERVVVTLEGVSKALASFEECRKAAPAQTKGNHDSAMNAFGNSSALHFRCRFRMSDVDGVDIPVGAIGGLSHRRQLEVTQAAITLDLRRGEFFVNGEKVEGAEVKQPDGKLPDGGAVMAFSDFTMAIGRAQGVAATRGLSAEDQAAFQDVLKRLGPAPKAVATSRYTLFSASGSGSLFFFDYREGEQATNQVGIHCE